MSDHYEVPDNTKGLPIPFDWRRLPTWAFQYVSVRSGGAGLVLDVGPYVGALPLDGGGTLYVVPRAGRAAFVRMLAKVEALDKVVVHPEEVAYSASGTGTEWLRLLAVPFVKRLQQIDRESPAFARVRVTQWSRQVRGTILPLPTALALARRADRPVRSRYRARTYDTPENRVLGAAAGRLLALGFLTAPGSRRVAARWVRQYRGQRPSAHDLRTVVGRLSRGAYDGPRAYYGPALLLARLIIAQVGLALEADTRLRAESLMTNVNTLFERYLRRTIRDGLPDCEVGQARDLASVDVKTLYDNGDVELIPDVVVVGAGGRRVVVDAKYKPSGTVTSADHHQMASYLAGYDAEVGVFVRPVTGGHAPPPRLLRRAHNGRRVVELAVSLDAIEEAERQVVRTVRQAFALSRRLERIETSAGGGEVVAVHVEADGPPT